MTYDNRTAIWCKKDAARFMDALKKAYEAGEIWACLLGDAEVRLEAMLKSSIQQRVNELAAEVVGLEAELNRAKNRTGEYTEKVN